MRTLPEWKLQERDRTITRGVGNAIEDLVRHDAVEAALAADADGLRAIGRALRVDAMALEGAVRCLRARRARGLPDIPGWPLWLGPTGLDAVATYRIDPAELPGSIRAMLPTPEAAGVAS
jgi:hypothetical protein